MASWGGRWLQRGVMWALAAWALAMYALMFTHLLADFPAAAPWSDMSKTTDEGWYSGAALHHFVFGHWYLPHSFNPAVAMPMWPLMLGGWFSLTGAGMLQARLLTVLLYGASLALMVALLREERCGWMACAGAVLLMAANPFCYVFDRMALLEPVTVFWWLVAVWIAGRASRGGWWFTVLTGAAAVALVWVKTPAVVLLLSVLYYMVARAKEQKKPWLRQVLVASGTAALLWGVYFFAWVRPRYLRDFKFVFTINNYRAHLSILPQVSYQAMKDGLWINAVLFPAALLAIAAAAWMRGLWRLPLFSASVIAVASYLAFVVYHGNLQPRYYLIVAAPLVMVLIIALEEFWREGMQRFALAIAGVLVVTALWMSATTIEYARHPAYTQRDMAMAVAETMRSEGGSSSVLFSGGGDDISLFTGVRAISYYEPEGIEPVLNQYQPEWEGSWMPWEKGIVAQFSPYYELHPVASFRVYDDQPGHERFVLYRMVRRPTREPAVH